MSRAEFNCGQQSWRHTYQKNGCRNALVHLGTGLMLITNRNGLSYHTPSEHLLMLPFSAQFICVATVRTFPTTALDAADSWATNWMTVISRNEVNRA
ncbi:hypothetical protein PTI98_009105 [Pleurotus ostreatus]|nr:hypothetical protein PTI98_009105 [Pleurotus ostreatus]